jgi:hypothetical protein
MDLSMQVSRSEIFPNASSLFHAVGTKYAGTYVGDATKHAAKLEKTPLIY